VGKKMMFLVGDNPFHGISHLSQERARSRGDSVTLPEYAANLVTDALQNGADGFMFSVSDTTLSILKMIRKADIEKPVHLFALVPYAYEYVRLATQVGGMLGLAKKIAKQIALSGNAVAVTMGLKGIIRKDPLALMRTYLKYEISRIKSSVGKHENLDSILLHEIITDSALGLNLEQLFKSYVDFTLKLGIKPGFETRNFPYLVSKFREWEINFHEVIIATPFNKIGFQMNPSRTECEKALADLPTPNVIAMSILGAGYLKLTDASSYLKSLDNLKGVVVGVSKENHARTTFRILKEDLANH